MQTSSIFQSPEEFQLILETTNMQNQPSDNFFEPLQLTTNSTQPQQRQDIIKRSSSSLPFPWKVHELLADAENQGFTSIVSWLPDYSGFKVHKTKAFEKQILPRYFKQTKYKSFRRQLNIWGFQRFEERHNRGGYSHPSFVRGRPALCHNMKRTQIKGVLAKGAKASSMRAVQAITEKSQDSGIDRSSDVPSMISIPSLSSFCSDPLFDNETLMSVLPSTFHGHLNAKCKRFRPTRRSVLELSLFRDQ